MSCYGSAISLSFPFLDGGGSRVRLGVLAIAAELNPEGSLRWFLEGVVYEVPRVENA